MTQPLDLDAITARTNAATPGPWWADGHEIYQGEPGIPGDLWIGETCNVDDLTASAANATFVAAARTDMPALIAEVTRLSAEQARLADFLRAGQQWRNGRLVIESCPSQPEIRAALGWPEPTAPTV